MIQLYVDDKLAFDSRLQDTALLGLKAQLGLNKGGAATIILPPGHPFYEFDPSDPNANGFTSYKSIVTIYRDGKLHFRGRALYPTDDFMLRRTITCEGERCFLRDGIHRPYSYNDTPKNIFREVINSYNVDVEAEKQFAVGSVNGISTDTILLENEEAETHLSVIDKLVEKCGGFITFSFNAAGQREINWVAKLSYHNKQLIEFGSNLMDFSRTMANTDLATRIIPYGAKNESTGERLTIKSVNNEQDFIQDDKAVALRGVVTKAVYFDEITLPDALLARAQQYLNTSKNVITSLELRAIDLALIDKNIDSFILGDIIEVRSKPHGINTDTFQLTNQDIDFLYPDNDRIVLSKDTASMKGAMASLTGSEVSSGKKTEASIQRLNKAIRSDYSINTEAIIEEAKLELSSLIQQAADALTFEVAETYATQEDLKSAISTTMTQLSDSFEFLFSELRQTVESNDSSSRDQFTEIKSYIRFQDGNIVLGRAGNKITLKIENDRISFWDKGAEVAYFSNQRLTVKDGNFLDSMRIGNFAFIPRGNKNLSLVKVGEVDGS
jgi:hypothetical protein